MNLFSKLFERIFLVLGLVMIVASFFIPPVITTESRNEYCEVIQARVNRNCTIFNTYNAQCLYAQSNLRDCRARFDRLSVSGELETNLSIEREANE